MIEIISKHLIIITKLFFQYPPVNFFLFYIYIIISAIVLLDVIWYQNVRKRFNS